MKKKKSYAMGANRYVWIQASRKDQLKILVDNGWHVFYEGRFHTLFEKARERRS